MILYNSGTFTLTINKTFAITLAADLIINPFGTFTFSCNHSVKLGVQSEFTSKLFSAQLHLSSLHFLTNAFSFWIYPQICFFYNTEQTFWYKKVSANHLSSPILRPGRWILSNFTSLDILELFAKGSIIGFWYGYWITVYCLYTITCFRGFGKWQGEGEVDHVAMVAPPHTSEDFWDENLHKSSFFHRKFIWDFNRGEIAEMWLLLWASKLILAANLKCYLEIGLSPIGRRWPWPNLMSAKNYRKDAKDKRGKTVHCIGIEVLILLSDRDMMNNQRHQIFKSFQNTFCIAIILKHKLC